MAADTRTTVFFPSDSKGLKEYHSIISITAPGEPFPMQMNDVVNAVNVLAAHEDTVVRFVRFFLSDATNQQPAVAEAMSGCAFPVSYIQQPPLDGTKLAAWVYASDKSEKECPLVWTAGLSSPEGDSAEQMANVFGQYADCLEKQGLMVAPDCVRTWIYVHDVDLNYAGVVNGRKAYFDTIGLTADTHYIASTGIEGRNADPHKLVTMDAVAVRGLDPSRIQYLYAKDHLSPTYDYGVTFERGTAVHFDDRTHVYISGTASIDHRGEVLHVGDVAKQTERMLDNIAALLSETEASMDDIAVATIYLRDTADYIQVKSLIDERLPKMNAVYVLAPVCRCTWLIEMECIAISK